MGGKWQGTTSIAFVVTRGGFQAECRATWGDHGAQVVGAGRGGGLGNQPCDDPLGLDKGAVNSFWLRIVQRGMLTAPEETA